MIKLLLADDQVSVRRGLRMRLELEPDLTVIGEAADGAEALLAAIRQAAWQPEGLVTPPLAGGGPASPGSRPGQPTPRGIRGEPQ